MQDNGVFKWWKNRSTMEQWLLVCLVIAVLFFTIFVVVSKKETIKEVIRSIPRNTTSKDNVCFTLGCIKSASRIFENMDPSVNPCDDFYQFACGKYLQRESIPDGERKIGNFATISKKVERQLNELVSRNITSKDLNAFRIVKNYYQACLSESHIEEEGVMPLKKILNDLGGWPVLLGYKWLSYKYSWTDLMYNFTRLGYPNNCFFTIGLAPLAKNNSHIIIYLERPPTALINVARGGWNSSVVQNYYKHMVDVAVKFGANRTVALKELKETVEFEIKLSNISRRVVPANKTAHMTLKQLNHTYPSIPWMEYVHNFLAPHATIRKNETLVVGDPQFFHDLEELMNKTSKRVTANYALWRLIDLSAPFVTKEIQRRKKPSAKPKATQVEILKTFEMNVGPAEVSRSRVCLGHIVHTLSVGTSAMYVRNYVNKKLKVKSTEMVNDIRTAFRKILLEVDWMDKATKDHALRKADMMNAYVAYPDELFDNKKVDDHYEGLNVNSKQFLMSMLNISLFERKLRLTQYTKPIKKGAWQLHTFSMIVNAFNYPLENSINFPAAILQDPFYNTERPQYMNYGSIGYVVGHEITHGFDNIGRLFDENGNRVDWWSKQSNDSFNLKSQCIVEQYGKYEIKDIHQKINGTKTLGENIADIGASKIIIKAYEQWTMRHGTEPKLPGLNFTNHQMMWLSLASMWCEKTAPDFMKQMLLVDPHSPGVYRVIGSVSNSRDFAREFNCSLGSNMNPVKKCALW